MRLHRPYDLIMRGHDREAPGAEVKDAGFATHFIPSSRLPDLERGILALGPSAADLAKVDSMLHSLEQPPAAGSGHSALLEWKLPLINAHFGLGSVGEVVASLQAAVDAAEGDGGNGSGSEAARAFLRDTLAAMRRGSPLSHAVTWEMLRRSAAGHLTLQQCLQLEFWLARRFVAGEADFLEGVRALLIDKDNKPRWRYGDVKQVPGVVVQRLFEPLPDEPPLFSGCMGVTAAGAHASRM
ncbi:hypothetical protein Vafri_16512 [Volvox africanus]|uniref:3-hydroxyisobutyryl-CoA hydrolase n=1 Tax=Volvox africanus TaxID=51714 RepID=A0A8J4BNI7_9CHLO|nr:hypothetical protein Vafri_16512 [Volvox africanus]